ncbi:MAG: heparinase II/III family protein [Nanoarchaeota archaeon]|nr:heparinase II/III family protein [Nanoarchaeota archaeon]
MRSFFIVACLIIFLVSMISQNVDAQIIETRPRIYLDGNDVIEIKERILREPYLTQWNTMKNYADTNTFDPYSNWGDWQKFFQEIRRYVQMYSFVHLIEEPDPADPYKYCIKAKSLLDVLNDDDIFNAISAPSADLKLMDNYARSFAIAYDYCRDVIDLDPPTKTYIEQRLMDAGNYYLTYNWDERIETHSRYHGVIERMTGSLMIPIAISGEGIDDDLANDLLAKYEALLLDTLHASDEAGSDGGNFEGMEYGRHINGDLIGMMAIMESATNTQIENYFGESFDHLSNLPEALIYSIRPDMKDSYPYSTFFRKGDIHYPELINFLDVTNPMYIASRYGNGHAQWLTKLIAYFATDPADPNWNLVFTTVGPIEKWSILIFYDDSVQELLPEGNPNPEDDFPLVKNFDTNTGDIFMKNSWDLDSNSGTIFANFKCGYYFDAHQHHDQASFVISRGDDSLAIDSGGYDAALSDHVYNYYHRTIAHNSILVHDPDEDFGIYSNDGGQRFLRLERDTVGQPIMPGDVTNNDVFQTCDIENFEDNVADAEDPGYTYIKANPINAYSDKITSYTREFVFVKPDFFVVYDIVDASNPTFEKTWVMHTTNSINIYGDLITSINSPSKITVKSLLPESKSISSVGDIGNEFSVEGVNYPFCDGCAVDPPNEPGKWRVEIKPTVSSQKDYFLNVLYPDDWNGFLPDIYLVEDYDGFMYGSMVMDSVGENKLVMFSKDSQIDEAYYDLPAFTTGLTHNIVTGLDADTSYYQSATEGCNYIQTSPSGILEFRAEDDDFVMVSLFSCIDFCDPGSPPEIPPETRDCGLDPLLDGIGICHFGESSCGSDHRWGEDCDGLQGPETEVCDGLDNDCDSELDEDFDVDLDTYTTCGSKTDDENYYPGLADCSDDNPLVNPGMEEICEDTFDNDCDGAADCADTGGGGGGGGGTTRCTEGDTKTTGCSQLGICEDSVKTCVNRVWNDCSITPLSETCNRKDDDCDGTIDDVGDKSGVEETSCWCFDGTTARKETCNGIDDDCNEQIDDIADCCAPGEVRACGPDEAGMGICRSGISTCGDDMLWDECKGAIYPIKEIMNEIDDNCNGIIDDVFIITEDNLYIVWIIIIIISIIGISAAVIIFRKVEKRQKKASQTRAPLSEKAVTVKH